MRASYMSGAGEARVAAWPTAGTDDTPAGAVASPMPQVGASTTLGGHGTAGVRVTEPIDVGDAA